MTTASTTLGSPRRGSRARRPAPPPNSFVLPVHAMSPAHFRRALNAGLYRFLAAEFPALSKFRAAQR